MIDNVVQSRYAIGHEATYEFPAVRYGSCAARKSGGDEWRQAQCAYRTGPAPDGAKDIPQ